MLRMWKVPKHFGNSPVRWSCACHDLIDTKERKQKKMKARFAQSAGSRGKSTNKSRKVGETQRLKKAPRVMQVNNSIGPHYGGNGLNHGIQIQNGPHKGRLAFAERFDCPGVDESAPYWRSYVLYSDDEGKTWTTGQLLPEELQGVPRPGARGLDSALLPVVHPCAPMSVRPRPGLSMKPANALSFCSKIL